MKQTDLLYFEALKSEIEKKHLLNYTPTSNNISNWKGIDIIYFQEDLRKKTKSTISEKSFYNYFKSPSIEKIPRIDMLNILSIYIDYDSWADFKHNHKIKEIEESQKTIETREQKVEIPETKPELTENEKTKEETEDKKSVLQKNNNDNQLDKQKPKRYYFWTAAIILFLSISSLLIFKEDFFSQKYTYTFTDADRNSKIKDDLTVRILKENESPILFKVKANSPFTYTTHSKTLKMVVSSPFYKTDTIFRNLSSENRSENIELKPNDYAIMLFYYSKSIQNVKEKRRQLNKLISSNALIYQVYDNTTYGVETLDKRTYINLVTTPTTSLKNLEVIDTKMTGNKITLIKFRIKTDENASL